MAFSARSHAVRPASMARPVLVRRNAARICILKRPSHVSSSHKAQRMALGCHRHRSGSRASCQSGPRRWRNFDRKPAIDRHPHEVMHSATGQAGVAQGRKPRTSSSVNFWLPKTSAPGQVTPDTTTRCPFGHAGDFPLRPRPQTEGRP